MLKASGNTFKQISEFMGIPQTNCFNRHGKLMRNAIEWDDELNKRLEKAYQKRREEMWKGIATDLGVPWKAVEDHTWDLGKKKFVRN